MKHINVFARHGVTKYVRCYKYILMQMRLYVVLELCHQQRQNTFTSVAGVREREAEV